MTRKNISIFTAINWLTDNRKRLGFDAYESDIMMFAFRQCNDDWTGNGWKYGFQFSMGHDDLLCGHTAAWEKLNRMVELGYLDLIERGNNKRRGKMGMGKQGKKSIYTLGRKTLDGITGDEK